MGVKSVTFATIDVRLRGVVKWQRDNRESRAYFVCIDSWKNADGSCIEIIFYACSVFSSSSFVYLLLFQFNPLLSFFCCIRTVVEFNPLVFFAFAVFVWNNFELQMSSFTKTKQKKMNEEKNQHNIRIDPTRNALLPEWNKRAKKQKLQLLCKCEKKNRLSAAEAEAEAAVAINQNARTV